MGAGDGEGGGAGKNDDAVVAGGVAATVFTVLMCTFGVPMFIAGIVLVLIGGLGGSLYSTGIGLLVTASLLCVGGILLIILLCTGVCGNKKQRAIGVTPMQTTAVVMSTQSASGGYYTGYAVPPPAHLQQPYTGYSYPTGPAAPSYSYQQAPPSGYTGQQYPGQPDNTQPLKPPPYDSARPPASAWQAPATTTMESGGSHP